MRTRSLRSTSSWCSPAPTKTPRDRASPAASSSAPGGATAFGDYVAGSNHVLPTGGAARFCGPAGTGRLHAPHLGRERAGGRRRRAGAARSRRSRAPRDSPCTASRPAPGRRRVIRETTYLQVSFMHHELAAQTSTARPARPTSACSLDLDGGEVSVVDRRRLPRPHARAAWAATDASASASRPAATSRPARTTPSRTSASPSARRSTRRSATARASGATRTR